MKKSENIPQFNTLICESEHSKKTVIGAITEIRNHLSEKIYVVENGQVSSFGFSEVNNYNSCISLTGYEVQGFSLYKLYGTYQVKAFYSEETREFLSLVQKIAESLEILRQQTGVYPPLLLNGIFIHKTVSTRITFLPVKMVTSLNKYYDIDKQGLLNFCTEIPSSLHSEGERLSFALARLIYLFFTKNRASSFEPVFDISSLVENTPRGFAKTLWDILHGKKRDVESLNQAIDEAQKSREKAQPDTPPLFRRESILLFKHRMHTLLRTRWKIIVTAALILGIVFYLTSDAFLSKRSADYTSSLTAREAVELYFAARENLDIETIDSLFYKRAGKEVKKELSSLYVISRIEQAYGKGMIKSQQPDSEQTDSEDARLFRIKDLRIEQIGSGENPLFIATYKKVIREEDKKVEYSIEEKIYLKRIHERWYIINNEIMEMNGREAKSSLLNL